ncbi:hypothetical protein Mgra_00001802 [Meloidogyne graminicola]|uniref:Defensin-like protein n=1 Tax=Meloidogyne graminicola TaxID=189291 RepID=A0A8S9ZZL9_9BILA|nr:hypothetical protein Mgra_00001802 [Meloidogyne graminicola]
MFKIFFLFFNLFFLIFSELINEEHTKLCLEQSNNCGIFTNCCNTKCGPNNNQSHKCFSFMGEIQKDQTFCYCYQINNQQQFNNNNNNTFKSKSSFPSSFIQLNKIIIMII